MKLKLITSEQYQEERIATLDIHIHDLTRSCINLCLQALYTSLLLFSDAMSFLNAKHYVKFFLITQIAFLGERVVKGGSVNDFPFFQFSTESWGEHNNTCGIFIL